jgi:hypothetical protein
MAERIEVKIEDRSVTGKKVKFLRNKGTVPVHLFGHNVMRLAWAKPWPMPVIPA